MAVGENEASKEREREKERRRERERAWQHEADILVSVPLWGPQRHPSFWDSVSNALPRSSFASSHIQLGVSFLHERALACRASASRPHPAKLKGTLANTEQEVIRRDPSEIRKYFVGEGNNKCQMKKPLGGRAAKINLVKTNLRSSL